MWLPLAIAGLDDIPGIEPSPPRSGLDMSVLPTHGQHSTSGSAQLPCKPAHCREPIRGKRATATLTLQGVLGEVAAAAAKPNTQLDQRYRRLSKGQTFSASTRS